MVPPHLHCRKVNEEEMSKLVLFLVTSFTTTLRHAILFSYDCVMGLPCYVKNEDIVHIDTFNFISRWTTYNNKLEEK